jgi:hypothetical protein
MDIYKTQLHTSMTPAEKSALQFQKQFFFHGSYLLLIALVSSRFQLTFLTVKECGYTYINKYITNNMQINIRLQFF